jgi:diguanylate cyclase (GGDEF)-like protein
VLLAASRVDLPLAVVLLAVATLVASAARTVVTFALVRDVAVIRTQAMTDDLTGVANRRALYDQIDRSLESRVPGRVVGLALLDLDRFKEVNDSLGHQAGDGLLQAVSERLTSSLAAIDPSLVLARLGGDEFAVLAPDAVDADAVIASVELACEVLRPPVELDSSMAVHVGVSIGVALAPAHAETRIDLLRCADAAMYAAKRASGSLLLFRPEMSAGTRERLREAEDLRLGIARAELVVHYQPQLDLIGNVHGLEALVRWDRPGTGLVMPDSFLRVAEDHMLMPAVTRIVLDIALGDCAALRRAGHGLSVSVNLAVGDLLDEGLPDLVRERLVEHGVPAASLTFEITETSVMTDPVAAQVTLERLSALGVGLSVDDYGTGHCSLTYLRSLPVQELKLDRSFVTGMASNAKDAAIARSSVDLAHSLGMRMVAEGVEDAEAAALLLAAGCDLVQGWYYARAMPLSDLRAWLHSHSSGSRSAQSDARRPVPSHGQR